MEYRNHKVIKQIVADSNKAFATCSFDILTINPNNIPQYARLVSRYQDLIRRYDMLTDDQQKSVQANINAITKQLTLLLKYTTTKQENPAKAIYLLGLIGNLEREMIRQLDSSAMRSEYSYI
jgi:hypothetical protein